MKRSDPDELSAVCHALAEPTRRSLLAALARQPGATTTDLAATAPRLTRWAVMKHLTVLREAGLIQTLPEGRRRRHYRVPGGLRHLLGWLTEAE
ncbi:MAG: helix-turn-helix domain-containing protein [Chloroflexota bacterium]|nr:helix-turn-helix domain-containing protein [Chloroflexota bacterium]